MDDYDFDNEFDVEEFDGPAKKTVTKAQTKDSDPYLKRKQSFGGKDKKDDGFEAFDEVEDWDDPETTVKPKVKKEEPKKKEIVKPIEKDIDYKPRASQNKVVAQKRKDSEEFVDDFEDEHEEKIETPKPKVEVKPDVKPQIKAEPKKEIYSPAKNDYDDDDDFEKEEVSPVRPNPVEEKPKPKEKVIHSPPVVQNKKYEETYSDEEMDDNDDYREPEPVVESKPKTIQKTTIEKPISQQVRAEMQTPQYQKLVEQNRKLKTELRELAKAADEALQRERLNKSSKKYNRDEEPELKEKMQELKDQLAKIDQLKHHITIMKRQLKNTYNLPKVIEKEDELKAAQKELAKVVDEKNSLLKIKKEQNKALDFLNNEGEYEKKLKQVTTELRQVKDEYRKENELFNENDKAMKKLHEKIIVMEEKCRDLQKKIKDKKGDKVPKSQGVVPEVSQHDIEAMEDRIRELQDKKQDIEKGFEDEMKGLERKKKTLMSENAKLGTQLKEKEKEIRLNNLRLKELRKLTRYNAVKPLENNDSKIASVVGNRLSSRSRDRERESPEEEERTNSIPKNRKEVSKGPQKKIPIAAAKKKITEESQGKVKRTTGPEVSQATKKDDDDDYQENYDGDNFENDDVDEQFHSEANRQREEASSRKEVQDVKNDDDDDDKPKDFSKPSFMMKKKKY